MPKTTTPHPKLPGTIHTAAEDVERAGGKALALAVDIRDEAQGDAAIAAAVARFGGIDILGVTDLSRYRPEGASEAGLMPDFFV